MSDQAPGSRIDVTLVAGGMYHDIDFARREVTRPDGTTRELSEREADLLHYLAGSPTRAIARNVIVLGVGFLPLLGAPLVPYNTVGFLMAAIMAVSSIVTVLLLPAIMMNIQKWLFPKKRHESADDERTAPTLKEQTT